VRVGAIPEEGCKDQGQRFGYGTATMRSHRSATMLRKVHHA